jgi:hypothetical protein
VFVRVVLINLIPTYLSQFITMIFRNLSLFLVFLSGVSASGSLRANENDATTFTEQHMLLFREWSETHKKEYSSEKMIFENMRVWLENDGE